MLKTGTSGYVYSGWAGCFYPPGLPKSKYLEYYSQFFDTLELNSTFYKTPKETTFKSWKYRLKKYSLHLSIKANREITHTHKLKNPDIAVEFIKKAELMGENLECIIFQLPPSMKKEIQRVDDFLKTLPKDKKYAVEFRHKSWYDDEVYDVLKKHNTALVWHDFNQEMTKVQTADFIYMRFHGYTGKYTGSYPDEVLKTFTQYKNGYVYFNNTDDCSAPFDALRLKKMIENKK